MNVSTGHPVIGEEVAPKKQPNPQQQEEADGTGTLEEFPNVVGDWHFAIRLLGEGYGFSYSEQDRANYEHD
jgi:hypothetical protein